MADADIGGDRKGNKDEEEDDGALHGSPPDTTADSDSAVSQLQCEPSRPHQLPHRCVLATLRPMQTRTTCGLAAILTAVFLSSPSFAAQQPAARTLPTLPNARAPQAAPVMPTQQVDLELVIATDVSGSIDNNEAYLQRKGMADAFRHKEVVDAIRNGRLGRIGVVFVD